MDDAAESAKRAASEQVRLASREAEARCETMLDAAHAKHADQLRAEKRAGEKLTTRLAAEEAKTAAALSERDEALGALAELETRMRETDRATATAAAEQQSAAEAYRLLLELHERRVHLVERAATEVGQLRAANEERVKQQVSSMHARCASLAKVCRSDGNASSSDADVAGIKVSEERFTARQALLEQVEILKRQVTGNGAAAQKAEASIRTTLSKEKSLLQNVRAQLLRAATQCYLAFAVSAS
jgi:hypothetical protein